MTRTHETRAQVKQLQPEPILLPPKVETLDYDDDGNLLQTARWQCAWDAENRLVSVEERHHASRPAQAPPRARLEFAYDQQGRRVRKVVRSWDSGTGQFAIVSDTRFVYDGWNMIAELDATPGLAGESSPRLVASHAWGLDLSGTETGAGGVGGLVLTKLHATTVNNSQPPPTSALAPAYDGNGNVLAYLDCATGKAVARYEYDAYGNVIEKEEAPAVTGRLHHQFSTKFTDEETGMLYYGFRCYIPELGRWPSRDPIGERGGKNLYGMCRNNTINRIDRLGKKDCEFAYAVGHNFLMQDLLDGYNDNGGGDCEGLGVNGCNMEGDQNPDDTIPGFAQNGNGNVGSNSDSWVPINNGGFNPQPDDPAKRGPDRLRNQHEGFVRMIMHNWEATVRAADKSAEDYCSHCKQITAGFICKAPFTQAGCDHFSQVLDGETQAAAAHGTIQGLKNASGAIPVMPKCGDKFNFKCANKK